MGEVAIREPNTIDTTEYVEMTATSLTLAEDTPWEVYEAVLGKLQETKRSLMWWIGDALAFGERHYGETYTQAVEATGYAVETLYKAASVSNRVEPCIRVQTLSWAHHQVVASLEPDDQRRWLEAAAPEPGSDHPKLSVSKLRAEIKAEREGTGGDGNQEAEPSTTGEPPSGSGWMDVPLEDFGPKLETEFGEDGLTTGRTEIVYPLGEGAAQRFMARLSDLVEEAYCDCEITQAEAERIEERGETPIVRDGKRSYERLDRLTLRDLPGILDAFAMMERR